MARHEVPSDAEVAQALRDLGDRVKAVDLCQALMRLGHPIRETQLAIQRAAERGRIVINHDLTLSSAREVFAA